MPQHTPSVSQRLHPPSMIAALVGLLRDAGIPATDALASTGLHAQALNDGDSLTSIAQYRAVCRNAITLTHDDSLPFRAGALSRLSDHGVYGLLMLSSESIGAYFRLAVRYQLLAAPTMAMAIDVAEDGDLALQFLPDDAPHPLPGDLRMFLVEQQAVQQLAHLDSVLGRRCEPVLACFDYPAPRHRALYAQYLRCPCLFDQRQCELRFPSASLDQRPQLANAQGTAVLQAHCDELVADIEASSGIAGEVYRMLQHMHDPGAGMKAVAAVMKITDRTLRRRLADEGTSFSAISHDVKYRVAAEHLKRSTSSIEKVAAIAGFSDAANFRRAFIRWTRMTPAQFRRLQHR